MRQSVIGLINRQADLICCGETDTVAATASLVGERQPNLVLLDLRLKDGDSFDLVAALGVQFPKLPVLILSQCDSAIDAEAVLRRGAKGYVLKAEGPEELLAAIRSVLLGNLYVSRDMTARLLRRLLGRDAATTDPAGRDR